MAKALEKAGKITNLYHIQNGTLTTEDEDIIQGLENTVQTGKFSVNPRNNPTFIVNSRNAFVPAIHGSLENSDFEVTSGSSYLEVEVTPGLDKKPIDVETVAVSLVECNDVGEYTDASLRINLVNSGHTEAGTYSDVKITKSGTSYKFKTSKQIGKNNYLELNNDRYYRVIVEGKDVAGNDIICDDNYSFKLVASGNKIELYGKGLPEYISQDPAAWQGSHEKFKAELSWTGGEPPYDIYRINESNRITRVTNPTNVDGEDKWIGIEEFNYSEISSLGFPNTISYKIKKDGADVSTTATINIKYDTEKPSISNINLKTVSESKNDYYNESEKKYYVRNTTDARFEISGIATDYTGIESVTLNIPGLSPVTIDNESRFKFTNLDLSSLTTEVTATITATDPAGNQYTSSITIVTDTQAPYSFDEIDSSSKNLEMRLGSANNDDITEDDALWDDNKDKDVGGKYSNGTFGNTKTLELRGDIKDDGSGLAKIYYMVDTQEYLIPEQQVNESDEAYEERVNTFLNNLKQTVLSKKKIITPLEVPEIKRVFYNVAQKNGAPDSDAIFENSIKFTTTVNSKGYYKYYKEVESTFKDNITGLEEGNNYLILVAEDNVGNTEIISTDVFFNGKIQKFINYSINIDITAPSDIINRTSSGIIFTNINDMPILWGTVSDKCEGGAAAAGIDSLKLSRDGVNTKLNADFIVISETDDDDLLEFVEGLNITPAQITELKAAGALDPTLVIWKKTSHHFFLQKVKLYLFLPQRKTLLVQVMKHLL